MNIKDVTQENNKSKTRASIGFIAESIRRLNSSELARLVETLCEDNMGQKLQTALSYENIDRDFRKD
tara:strand:- start:1761 stop:1961 length:201 start_codon:yes stop_codon:yes gene_type:complete